MGTSRVPFGNELPGNFPQPEPLTRLAYLPPPGSLRSLPLIQLAVVVGGETIWKQSKLPTPCHPECSPFFFCVFLIPTPPACQRGVGWQEAPPAGRFPEVGAIAAFLSPCHWSVCDSGPKAWVSASTKSIPCAKSLTNTNPVSLRGFPGYFGPPHSISAESLLRSPP